MNNKDYRTGKLNRQTWTMLKVLSAHRGQSMIQVADDLVREAYHAEVPEMRNEDEKRKEQT